jgi:hypothetical protein
MSLVAELTLGLAQLLSGNAADAMQSMEREPLEVHVRLPPS